MSTFSFGDPSPTSSRRRSTKQPGSRSWLVALVLVAFAASAAGLVFVLTQGASRPVTSKADDKEGKDKAVDTGAKKIEDPKPSAFDIRFKQIQMEAEEERRQAEQRKQEQAAKEEARQRAKKARDDEANRVFLLLNPGQQAFARRALSSTDLGLLDSLREMGFDESLFEGYVAAIKKNPKEYNEFNEIIGRERSADPDIEDRRMFQFGRLKTEGRFSVIIAARTCKTNGWNALPPKHRIYLLDAGVDEFVAKYTKDAKIRP